MKEIVRQLTAPIEGIISIVKSEDVIDTLRIFVGISCIIPIVFTIVSTTFVGIIGYEIKYTYLETLKILWIDYYLTGHLFDIQAWKWHLGIIFLLFVFVKIGKQ